MAKSIFGHYSKDGYGYWGYVEVHKKMMLFTNREEYLEYISEHEIYDKEPYARAPFPFVSSTNKEGTQWTLK